jgi:TolB protein
VLIKRTTAVLAALLSAAACDNPADPEREVPLSERVIAFSQDGDIWRMNADGTGVTRLTSSPAPEDNPAWSPDGNSIYYDAVLGGVPYLFRMNADGSNHVQLTGGPTVAAAPAPAPDGQRLAFVTAGQDLDLAVRAADGAIMPLTALPGHESSPAWSRVGGRIAFSRSGAERGLYTVRPDGAGVVRLTTWQSELPSWSPDGTRMVVLGGPEPGARLWVLRADGSGSEPLTPAAYFTGAADWSSDGRWIVFSAAQPAPAGFWIIRPDGSNLQRLSYTGIGQLPRWQPLPQRVD